MFVDDIVVSTGEGSTSFETGLDGWTVPGAPAGSPGNENDWIVGTADDVPPPAGQWYGDSLAVQRWRHIWLNEGFATYTEWLWSEREGLGTAQEIFDFFISDDFVPADHELWQLVIGDPGPDHLFDFPVYFRGAMTLHTLRVTVGDADFFRILRRWAQSRAGDNVTTPQFIRLAERISGEQLDALFQTWLFTPGRPAVSATGRPSQSVMPPGAEGTFTIAKREGSLKR